MCIAGDMNGEQFNVRCMSQVSTNLNWEVSKMVDSKLGNDWDPEVMSGFVEIAKKCLSQRGEDRPSMQQVIHSLVIIQKKLIAPTRQQSSTEDTEMGTTIWKDPVLSKNSGMISFSMMHPISTSWWKRK